MITLLGNAVKYTDRGFVQLTVSAANDPQTSECVTLAMEVLDSGRGIKPDKIESLFDEYVQLDESSGMSVEGVGFGLTITKALLNEMGGKISVDL